MKNIKNESKIYIHSLDGLRFIASLNIVLLHMSSSQSLGMLGKHKFLLQLIKGPMFNASVFFILGGLIYFVKLQADIDNLDTKRFLRGRFKRLYPTHIITAATMAVLIYLKTTKYSVWFLIKSFFAHATLTWAFFPHELSGLNGPSWALTPFFIAYLTIKPITKAIKNENRYIVLILSLFACLIPITVATFQYIAVRGAPGNIYMIFHAMPFVRVCEFYLGMILGKLYLMRRKAPNHFWINDLAIVLSVFSLWFSLRFKNDHGLFAAWFTHHVIRTAIYGVIIWFLAKDKGLISRIFTLKPVKVIGKSSFYPYLWHVPLLNLVYQVTRSFNYHKAFYKMWHLFAFLIVLYGFSVLFSYRKKLYSLLCPKQRRKT
ncbi:MAG: acyltransferase [Fibrobacter sp.]|nr:acyltransferase [Fibrobacter sp.]